MTHKQGGRIQELETQIKQELEKLGIIGLRIYFGNNKESPKFEYQLREAKN